MINLGVGASDVKTLGNAANMLGIFKCLMAETRTRLQALLLCWHSGGFGGGGYGVFINCDVLLFF